MSDKCKWVVCDNLVITRSFFFKRNKSKFTDEEIEVGIINLLNGKDVLNWGIMNDVATEIKNTFKCTEKYKLRNSVILPENSNSVLKFYDGDSEGFFEDDDFEGSTLCEMPSATDQIFKHDTLANNGLDIELQISFSKRLSYKELSLPLIELYKDEEGYISADVWKENGCPVGFPNNTNDAEIASIKVIFK